MENYKSDLIQEKITIRNQTNETFSKLTFMMKQNLDPNEHLL